MLALGIEMLPYAAIGTFRCCFLHGENLPSLAAHGGQGHIRSVFYQFVRGTDTSDLVGCREVHRHPSCRGLSLKRLRALGAL